MEKTWCKLESLHVHFCVDTNGILPPPLVLLPLLSHYTNATQFGMSCYIFEDKYLTRELRSKHEYTSWTHYGMKWCRSSIFSLAFCQCFTYFTSVLYFQMQCSSCAVAISALDRLPLPKCVSTQSLLWMSAPSFFISYSFFSFLSAIPLPCPHPTLSTIPLFFHPPGGPSMLLPQTGKQLNCANTQICPHLLQQKSLTRQKLPKLSKSFKLIYCSHTRTHESMAWYMVTVAILRN